MKHRLVEDWEGMEILPDKPKSKPKSKARAVELEPVEYDPFEEPVQHEKAAIRPARS